MSKYYSANDVSRAILELPDTENGYSGSYDKAEILNALEDIPTIEVSEDCVISPQYIDGYREAVRRLEKFYLEESKAVRRLEKFYLEESKKEGEWINKQEKYQMAECSNCKKVTMHEMWGDKLVYYDYCPNCGAKMKG